MMLTWYVFVVLSEKTNLALRLVVQRADAGPVQNLARHRD